MQLATEGVSIAETHANLHPSPRKTSAVRGPRLGSGGMSKEGEGIAVIAVIGTQNTTAEGGGAT